MQETVVLAGKIAGEAYKTHGSSACAPYEKFIPRLSHFIDPCRMTLILADRDRA